MKRKYNKNNQSPVPYTPDLGGLDEDDGPFDYKF
jgi:hypothetical protein